MNIIERLIPGVNRKFGTGSVILRQHILRYRFALAYMRAHDTILDAGCGCGYGTFLLAGTSARVVGIDQDAESIDYARTFYNSDNITWVCSSIEKYKGMLKSFSRIVCFETIEHCKSPEILIDSLSEMLCDGGILICSVPVIPTKHFNPFHKHDLTDSSFTEIFTYRGYNIIDKLFQEETYLNLVVSKSANPDLEAQPVIPFES